MKVTRTVLGNTVNCYKLKWMPANDVLAMASWLPLWPSARKSTRVRRGCLSTTRELLRRCTTSSTALDEMQLAHWHIVAKSASLTAAESDTLPFDQVLSFQYAHPHYHPFYIVHTIITIAIEWHPPNCSEPDCDPLNFNSSQLATAT